MVEEEVNIFVYSRFYTSEKQGGRNCLFCINLLTKAVNTPKGHSHTTPRPSGCKELTLEPSLLFGVVYGQVNSMR